jgi:alpha-D-ribose 1-methylphosphonate 5-triphosphate diphosphatase
MTTMRPLRIAGGQVLVDGALVQGDITLRDGRVDTGAPDDARTLDARGLLVLPGIVDIHGDAFERQFQPRPGIGFPTDLALEDTERQLLACGVTTAFHGVTLSWEPGLRSADAWRAMLDGLAARAWTCDMRVHLRWEAYNLDALDMAIADIAAGRVHLLAFNDHTPAILRKIGDATTAAKYSDRAGMALEAFRALAERIGARAAEVPAAQARIAAAARAAGLPMASHDDDTIAARDAFRAEGARICEFPMAEEVGQAARAAGDFVAMGSPNVVRGKSHLGWASAARLAEAGICDVLCSDYFYPCLLRAPFVLAGRGVLDLPRAWSLVSGNAATAAGLADRGSLAAGQRGDVVLVDASGPAPRLVATVADGVPAHLTAEGWGRLR